MFRYIRCSTKYLSCSLDNEPTLGANIYKISQTHIVLVTEWGGSRKVQVLNQLRRIEPVLSHPHLHILLVDNPMNTNLKSCAFDLAGQVVQYT